MSEDRTAVLVVHGMGEKRPLETLDDVTRTVLAPRTAHGEPTWDYYAHPAEITDTYEARRYVAAPVDIYEYHWSFLMTGSRYAGVMPTILRLFLRRPSNVPGPMFGIWRAVWCVLLAIVLAFPAMFALGYVLDTDFPGWIIGLVSSAVVLLFWLGLFRVVVRALVNSVTTSLVDVARYLDGSPYSYAARRAIRGGLVDLLSTLHDGRYSRVVVIAQGVGTSIAYDALTSLWATTHAVHAAPLGIVDGLQEAANRLAVDDGDAAIDDFQDRQFALSQELGQRGSSWRITDFVTVGAPLALADLLLTRPALSSGFSTSDGTRRRHLFDRLLRRGVVVSCPPQSETRPVDGAEHQAGSYLRDGALGPHCPFAVTRWTNLWFPVKRGELRGDWFGGALRPLFGPGIRDIAVTGNAPERFKRGSAHTEYFKHPEKGGDDDVAGHLRAVLAATAKSVELG